VYIRSDIRVRCILDPRLAPQNKSRPICDSKKRYLIRDADNLIPNEVIMLMLRIAEHVAHTPNPNS
jgi:hypothetical protein